MLIAYTKYYKLLYICTTLYYNKKLNNIELFSATPINLSSKG